ncbi:MAG TPA: L-aspartate oxidase [Rhizobiales bacterium]|nr:L-aspartate oxidase [bacterium BMS3Bbin10]HDO52223.1 L-aspartate oxidase [Hyphomicrobiales bacterium]
MVSAAPTSILPPAATGGQSIVIVGAGLAGLFTALKLAPHPVVLISPVALGEGTSSGWAQGGIAAAISEGDTPQAHARDTIRAGGGIVDEGLAHLLAREAPDRIDDLLRLGVPFDKDIEGKLRLSREAAHSARRIARVKGDLAGKAIMAAVMTAVRKTPSIHILEGMSVHALAKMDGRVCGVHLWPTGSLGQGKAVTLPAKAVVLASGGVGQLFGVTTNPSAAHGEGVAMAALAGAAIADPEFVQFHPTALNIGRDPAPLATEALRGEGATLINKRGERYMSAVHEDAELAPRDVVARATFREVLSGRGAFLDCRDAIGGRFAEKFPGLFETCSGAGIDPLREPIPVAPAAHYHMGGVLTDANGRTTVDGLWACGEVACTRIHGANRLASNSLLETIVFGARIAADISALAPYLLARAPNMPAPPECTAAGPDTGTMETTANRLRRTMTQNVGVVRSADGLRAALGDIAGILKGDLPPALRNRAITARFIAAGALAREESRGAQFRTDFPEPRAQWARGSTLTLDDAEAISDSALACAPHTSNVIHAAFGQ